jgi:hypothetical protein
LGQEVATLIDGIEEPGYKAALWNAANYSSGVYFYRLDAQSVNEKNNRFIKVKKMLLVK